MSRNESLAHLKLKALALDWARHCGLSAIAAEVSVPKSRFRADLAALEPKSGGKTAIFECKQARSDLLKDVRDSASTRAEIEFLAGRLRDLERLIGEHRPDLRKGDSLFPQFESVDLSATRHDGYRRVLSEMAKQQSRLIRGTKFSQLFRWRSADFFYLVSEPGIFCPSEVPAGWGLLVREGDRLLLDKRPVEVDSGDEARERLLRAIAIAGTRATAKTLGICQPPSARPGS